MTEMQKVIGRLTNILKLPNDGAGQFRSILMLDQLADIPEVGDVLRVENRNLPIAQVDGQKIRSCLTGGPLIG